MSNEKEIEALAAEAAQPSISEGMFDDDAELGVLAVEHDRLRALESRIEALKKAVSERIVSRMDSMGLDSVKAGGRRLSFRRQSYYGVTEDGVADLALFMATVAPEANIPASTNIKKAVDAFLDANPGANLPSFISKTESRSLVNAKA